MPTTDPVSKPSRLRPAVLQSGGIEVTLAPTTGARSRDESVYDVAIGGTVIGRVWRQPFTREKRTGNNKYVDRRWQSLAWTWSLTDTYHDRMHQMEAYSRQDAVDRLVRDHRSEP